MQDLEEEEKKHALRLGVISSSARGLSQAFGAPKRT